MRKRNELRTYQLKGYEHIINNPACALFKDMGLGKTATTLTAIKDMLDWMEISKVLVISTKQVANNVWGDEVTVWEHLIDLVVLPVNGNSDARIRKLKMKADIYTISIDNVMWLIARNGGSFGDFDMVILDESSLVKNPSTKRFKFLRKAFAKVNRKILLTGTPTPNGLEELWSQMYLLDGGARLLPTITAFRQTFTTKNGNGFGYKVTEKAKPVILKLIGDICLSIRAKDYNVEIPQIEITRFVSMDEKGTRLYKKFEKEAIHTFRNEKGSHNVVAINAAVLTGKLLQFANGGMYDENRVFHEIHDAKIQALDEILDEINSPVLVACNYIFDKERIKRLCEHKKLKVAVFDSKNISKSRQQILDWNAKRIEVLIMHPKSGGHGLNLQNGGHNIVWFGVSLSTEGEQQLNARLARTGQTETVRIIKILTKGTVEERFAKVTNDKKTLQNFVLDYLRDFA